MALATLRNKKLWLLIPLAAVMLLILKINGRIQSDKAPTKAAALATAQDLQTKLVGGGDILKDDLKDSCQNLSGATACDFSVDKVYRAKKGTYDDLSTLIQASIDAGAKSDASGKPLLPYQTADKLTPSNDTTVGQARIARFYFDRLNGLFQHQYIPVDYWVEVKPDTTYGLATAAPNDFKTYNTDQNTYYLYGLNFTVQYNDANSHWDKIKVNPFH